jgi:hypothetical protein
VEPEELAERAQGVGIGPLEVEPEEVVASQEIFDLRPVQRRQHPHRFDATEPGGQPGVERRCQEARERKRRGCPGRSSAPPVV